MLYPNQQSISQVIQIPFNTNALEKIQILESILGYEGGYSESSMSRFKKSKSEKKPDMVIHHRPTMTTLAPVVLQNFPS